MAQGSDRKMFRERTRKPYKVRCERYADQTSGPGDNDRERERRWRGVMSAGEIDQRFLACQRQRGEGRGGGMARVGSRSLGKVSVKK